MGIFWPHTVGDPSDAPPRFFETFSYLPPLTDGEIAKQVDYLIRKGFTPCVEFEDKETAYAARTSGMDSSASAGYYDNRYWSMWKLPMFGATDADSVLKEIKTCAVKFPNSFVRLSGFDANRQARAPAARPMFSVVSHTKKTNPPRAQRTAGPGDLHARRPPQGLRVPGGGRSPRGRQLSESQPLGLLVHRGGGSMIL